VDETIVVNGVTIIGQINLASTVPYHSSSLYARNLTAFLEHLVKNGKTNFDLSDEITRETMLTLGGQIVHARVREVFKLPPLTAPAKV